MPRSRVSIGLLGAGQWCKVCAHPKSAVSSVPRPLSERMKKAAATMYETASHSLSSMTAHAQRGAKPNSRRAQLEWELGQQPLPAVRAHGARQAGGAGSGWRAGRGLGRTLHVGRRAAPLFGTAAPTPAASPSASPVPGQAVGGGGDRSEVSREFRETPQMT